MSWLKTALLVSFLLFAMAGTSPAQTTFATITGSVTDSSGAVVPNAKVTATRLETNIKSAAQTNAFGNYTIAQLVEGTYEVRVQAPGFKELRLQGVVLTARDVRRVDASLQVGSVETAVEVKSGATLIETETARISDTKGAMQLSMLPLNAQRIWDFVALAPNVLQNNDDSSTIRYAGSRANQSDYTVDGTSVSSAISNTQVGPTLNRIESFAEVKIDMANNSADFGTIGQLTVITKSGTNALHGGLFDYYQTPWFRARNTFALQRTAGVAHAPGGGIGGPVYLPKLYDGRSKTFFFTSYDTTRGSAINQLLNPTVPLSAWRSGDFSALAGARILDPLTAQQFPGNRIPAGRINPVAQKIQDRFYPLPNFGDPNVLQSQNYREMKSRPYDQQPSGYWVARGDHHFSERDWVFGRFTYQRLCARAFQGNLPTIGRNNQTRNTRAATVAYTHTFRPALINEFRWGFSSDDNWVIPPVNGPQLVKDLGLVGLAPDLPDMSGILNISWSGLALAPITQPAQTRYRNHRLIFQEHLSWFRGKHNLKMGFQLTQAIGDSFAAGSNLFGTVTFSNRFSGYPYSDFLLGIPTSAARSFPALKQYRIRWEREFFFTDDFKVTPRLTLNWGLRYELHTPWRERGLLYSTFDVGSGKIVIADGAMSRVSSLMPKGYVTIVEANTLGLPEDTLIRPDRNNFAPRLGIAYRPWGNRTVFRAGYGVFYDSVPTNLTQGGVPFVINEPTYTNPVANLDVVFPRVFPATGVSGPATVSIPTAVNPGLRTPYSMQYNFTIEHARWNTGFRLSYIGTNTRKGLWSYNYNSPVPDTRAYVDKPRAFATYPAISYLTNGAGHQYNSLTAEAMRSMARGLYFQGSWVWARDIGDLEQGQAAENPFDRRRERAVDMSIPTHRVTSNLIYQLPFGKGRRWLSGGRLANLAVGGWELSAIYSSFSGMFLTPLWTGPDPTGTAYSASRTPASVTIRPDQLRDANLPADQRTLSRWFDTGAFQAPRPGQFGTSAKGVIIGPHVNACHMGIFKSFEFGERRPRLRWEATATNLFNHPNYSNPALNISQAAGVGVISGAGGVQGFATGDAPGPRAFRMGLRVEW